MRVCPECKQTFTGDQTQCPADGALLIELPDPGEARVFARDGLQRLQGVEASSSRYTIAEKIGQGGWGGVYRAYQHSTKREVALKVLREDVASDPEARRRFHREAEAVSKLTHPNTVTIFDFGETGDGLLFIAMEYLEGRTVDQVVKDEGPLPPLRAAHIARQVALSLAEAHDKGIVHRDIKPQNILVSRGDDGEDFVKVLDFGVAKLVSVDTALTATGTTFGTPEYMSPEQVQSKTIDQRSDLYALGIVLYEMLAGKPPFSGKSAVTVALAHIRKRPPPLKQPAGLPKALLHVVRRLLAKDPNRRFDSAREAAAELARVLERLREDSEQGRTTQAVQLAIGTLAGNWHVIMTVVALVSVVIVGVVVLKARFLPPDAGAPKETEVALAPAPEPSLKVLRERAVAHPVEAAPAVAELEVRSDHERDVVAPPPVDVVAAPQPVEPVVEELPPVTPPPDVQVEPDRVAVALAPEVVPKAEVAKPHKAHETKSAVPPPVATEHTIVVDATVPDVRILNGSGKLLCRTPCPLRGTEGEELRIKLVREGYRARRHTLRFGSRDDELTLRLDKMSLSTQDGLKGSPEAVVGDGLK